MCTSDWDAALENCVICWPKTSTCCILLDLCWIWRTRTSTSLKCSQINSADTDSSPDIWIICKLLTIARMQWYMYSYNYTIQSYYIPLLHKIELCSIVCRALNPSLSLQCWPLSPVAHLTSQLTSTLASYPQPIALGMLQGHLLWCLRVHLAQLLQDQRQRDLVQPFQGICVLRSKFSKIHAKP